MSEELQIAYVELTGPASGAETGGAVSVNGVAISAGEINLESANYEGGTIPERQHQAALALVMRELLRQRALECDLLNTTGEPDDSVVDELLERELDLPQPDENACRRYFEQNRARFRGEDRAELRHILLPAHPDDPEERGRVCQRAQDLIASLQNGSGDFAELAREHSVCPSRAQGGALGWIGRGQTVPEFESTVLRLPVGLAGKPLESRYGWHVVDVLDRQTGTPLPFSQVRGDIARYLAQETRSRAIRQYLQLLVGRAEIEGIDLDGATSPLVR
ncbi:MAG: peptidylprolyl isomerase [Halioglobus sp.]|nr:peptidylprolyl isomerase [Halioglobus sp.]